MTVKDAELGTIIEGCLNNSRVSQQQLYNLLAPKLFAVCRRYAFSEEEAEDMFMDGFMNIFKSIRSYRNKSSFETWAHSVMVNTIIDHIRANQRFRNEQFVEDVSEYQNDYEDGEAVLTKLAAKEVLTLMDEMSEDARVIFNLRAVEEFSLVEIAKLLGKKEGTVRNIYMRARRWLQKRLKEQ